MPWSEEEYDDGYTRESFERADEDREQEPEEIYDECHEQGEEAARRGAAVEDNPYDANRYPLQHNAWRDGVMDFHDPTGRVK